MSVSTPAVFPGQSIGPAQSTYGSYAGGVMTGLSSPVQAAQSLPASSPSTAVGIGVGVLGRVGGEVGGFFTGGGEVKTTYNIYRGLDAAGDIRYVGITKRAAEIRWAEHLNSVGTGKELLQYESVSTASTLLDARMQEQALIDLYGLGRNGGQLLNKINSIAP